METQDKNIKRYYHTRNGSKDLAGFCVSTVQNPSASINTDENLSQRCKQVALISQETSGVPLSLLQQKQFWNCFQIDATLKNVSRKTIGIRGIRTLQLGLVFECCEIGKARK